MTPILDALSHAFRDMFQFKVFWIVIWPMLAAISLWFVLGLTFWDTFSGWIASGLDAIGIHTWLAGVKPRWAANAIQAVIHLILFVPLVFITALLITAVFAMNALINLVAERDYPQLKRDNSPGMVGSLINTAVAICVFVAIWFLSLPLWLIGAGIVIPFIAVTYLNQRLFRYDAIAEHASRKEMQSMISLYRSSWWMLGLLTGLLQFVPLLNLFSAVLTALAFIHFGLARLSDLRRVS